MLSKFQSWYQWAADNGQTGKLMVGEIGWPQSSGARADTQYHPGFDLVGEQIYLDFDARGVHATQWSGANWVIDLAAYLNDTGGEDTLNYRSTVSSVIERHYTTGGTNVMRGFNYAGAEFSDVGPDGGLVGGTLHRQYYYPKAADIAKIGATTNGGRGVPLIRFPIRWERLQPTLKAAFNVDEVNLIKQLLTDCAASGVRVLIDLHNYGRYDTTASTKTAYNNDGVIKLGDNAPSAVGGSMISAFADFWSRFATTFNGYSALWSYGLMNEPQGVTGGAATWQEASRQAVEAIRAIDQTKYINVGGYAFSGIEPWVANNTVNGSSAAWLTETIPSGQTKAGQPRNNDDKIIWEGHIYYDYDGRYANTSYASDFVSLNQTAINNGYAAYSTSGYTLPASDITNQTTNLRQFSSTFTGTGAVADDFAGDGGSVTVASNTVTFGTNGLTLPSSSMKIVTTATSDTAGVRRNILTPTSSGSIRVWQVDFGIDSGSTLPSGDGNNFVISHAWRKNNQDSLIQVAVAGRADGTYKIGLRDPSDNTYSIINSGNTVLTKGNMYKVKVVVSDTDIKLYLNDVTTAEATFTSSLTNVAIGGYFRGKFYGTTFTGTMYYANEFDYNTATVAAPPSLGLIGVANAPISNTGKVIAYSTGGGGGGTTPPVTPPAFAGPVPINSWYPFGVKPNLSIAQLQSIARARYDKVLAYTYETSTGVNSGEARIKAPDQSFGPSTNGVNGTVSEGIAYAMLASSFFGNSNLPSGVYDSAAQGRFDKLYKYAKARFNNHGLMNWNWTANNTQGKDYSGNITGNGATDGDQDMAMALIMAARNWGDTSGAYNYTTEAKSLINNISTYEYVPANGTYPNAQVNGDVWGFESVASNFYPDYFAPGFMREFGIFTGNTRWTTLISANFTYAVAPFYNTGTPVSNSNGLITDIRLDTKDKSGDDIKFGYNDIRYPWRLAYDYVTNGTNTNVLAYNALNRLVSSQKTRYATVGVQKAEPYIDYSKTGDYFNAAYAQAFGVGSVVSADHSQWGADTMTYMSNDTGDSYFGGWLQTLSAMLLAGIMQSTPGTGTGGGTVPPVTSILPRIKGAIISFGN